MTISYKGDYSLKIILDLTFYYPDTLVHIEDLAKRQDIPKKFLEQILLDLKKGGFVASKKGPNGGYYLTKNPKNITLGDVIRFIEGPIYPISCINPAVPQTCNEVKKCGFYSIWQDISKAISGIIDNITFYNIKEKTIKINEQNANMYYI